MRSIAKVYHFKDSEFYHAVVLDMQGRVHHTKLKSRHEAKEFIKSKVRGLTIQYEEV